MADLKRFLPVALALAVAVGTTAWFTLSAPSQPSATTAAGDVISKSAADLAAASVRSKLTKVGGPRNAGTLTANAPAALSVEDRYLRSNDLHSYYEEMMALSAAGDAQATYHAALALHECWLANTRTNGWSCHAGNGKSTDVVRLCSEMKTRCEGFADQSNDWIMEEREALYEEAAAAGYERGVARTLTTLSESDPELALSLARDLINTTDDFGTLFHVGRFLQNRLWRDHQGWIGGEWDETTNRPGASARYGQAAWQLAACDLNNGCPDDSVFMRSLCVTGNGCQPGWHYLDWLAYYRSPYELEQIRALTESIRAALAAGDVETIIDRGEEQPPSEQPQ